VLARWCHSLPKPLFLGALADVAGEIEGSLIKTGDGRDLTVRLAGMVRLSACEEWQRLRAFASTAGGRA
jgi:hypothetical protein